MAALEQSNGSPLAKRATDPSDDNENLSFLYKEETFSRHECERGLVLKHPEGASECAKSESRFCYYLAGLS